MTIDQKMNALKYNNKKIISFINNYAVKQQPIILEIKKMYKLYDTISLIENYSWVSHRSLFSWKIFCILYTIKSIFGIISLIFWIGDNGP